MKLSSMRYQTLSTFTEFKRNKEKTDNEVNDKDISVKSFPCLTTLIMFRPLMCIGFLFWGRPKSRRRKRTKEKKRERAKAKMQRIMKASSQEGMRLRKRSSRMTRMMARMRAKCRNNGTEVYFIQKYIS